MTGDAARTALPILLYHGVADDADGPDAPWVVTPDEFDRHLDIVEAEGLRTSTVSDLVRRVHHEGRTPEPAPIAITFDDGFADFATGAWPRLTARAMASTLYVTTGGIGSTATWLPADGSHRPMLDWSTLTEIGASGVEIGGHTHTHPQLDLLDIDDARRDIRVGREVIEDRLGHAIETFAYPHGYHTPALEAVVADEGFTSACEVGHAFSSAADDRFALARVMIRHGDSLADIRRWVRGEGLPIRPRGRRRLLAAGWRQVRRHRVTSHQRLTATQGASC